MSNFWLDQIAADAAHKENKDSHGMYREPYDVPVTHEVTLSYKNKKTINLLRKSQE